MSKLYSSKCNESVDSNSFEKIALFLELETLEIRKRDKMRLIFDDFSKKYSVPVNMLRFYYDGERIDPNSTPESLNLIDNDKIDVMVETVGGKGGFGAMLKAKAKQKGKQQTVDFGACRDLNGRRLRHKNNEILLEKWKEAKENNKPFDVEENTPTGISNWYLQKPSWADNIKNNNKLKKFQKSKYKSMICGDWERARAQSTPPDDAPIFWGCPRGANCNFAHGEDELNKSADEINNDKPANKKVKVDHKEKDDYVNSSMIKSDVGDDVISLAILKGLENEKIFKENKVLKEKENNEVDELPLDDYGF